MIDIDKRLISTSTIVTSMNEAATDIDFNLETIGDCRFDWRHEIISSPILTPDSCQWLAAAADLRKDQFRSRVEDGRYATPQLLLREISGDAEEKLIDGIYRYLGPLTWAFWRILPNSFSAPFLVRYDSTLRDGLPAHHDVQSDISLSISLNDEFDGGGLYFPRQKLALDHRKPGFAFVFPGRVTHLHVGLPVHRGTRYILTVWCRHAEESMHRS